MRYWPGRVIAEARPQRDAAYFFMLSFDIVSLDIFSLSLDIVSFFASFDIVSFFIESFA